MRLTRAAAAAFLLLALGSACESEPEDAAGTSPDPSEGPKGWCGHVSAADLTELTGVTVTGIRSGGEGDDLRCSAAFAGDGLIVDWSVEPTTETLEEYAAGFRRPGSAYEPRDAEVGGTPAVEAHASVPAPAVLLGMLVDGRLVEVGVLNQLAEEPLAADRLAEIAHAVAAAYAGEPRGGPRT